MTEVLQKVKFRIAKYVSVQVRQRLACACWAYRKDASKQSAASRRSALHSEATKETRIPASNVCRAGSKWQQADAAQRIQFTHKMITRLVCKLSLLNQTHFSSLPTISLQ
jgi:hypothetical protein